MVTNGRAGVAEAVAAAGLGVGRETTGAGSPASLTVRVKRYPAMAWAAIARSVKPGAERVIW